MVRNLLGGVTRYDGLEFVTFTRKDGIADNRVTAITEEEKATFGLELTAVLVVMMGTAL